jgi:peptidase E
MKTVFLLHGGGTSKESSGNDSFFAQMTALVDKQTVRILLCYWARPTEQWNDMSRRDSSHILKQTNKSVEFHTVLDGADLYDKLPHFDVLYVAGGDDLLIEPYYDKLTELSKLLVGKVYAGSSMGAFLVSSRYVLSYDSQDTSTVHAGVGILPFQILCHWNVETEKERKVDLLSTTSDLPILTLNESEFVSIYY